MKLIDAYQKLERIPEAAITTRDAAGILHLPTSHASKILERLADAQLMVFIKKGLWGFPKRLHPFLLSQYCAAPFPSYVSLQTALYHYDMILQVPQVIYAVSLGRTKQLTTALGDVSLHHIDPSFFFGYEVNLKTGIAMASPEKALLDFFYFSVTKSHLFGTLPEVELPKTFSLKKAREMIKKIPFKQRRSIVEQRFEAFYKNLA